jgi:surface antigen
MRISRLLVPAGLTVAAAATLPLALTAQPAAAQVSGISVSTTGSTVSVVTSACSQINGSWGTAALLSSGQTSFAQGRQVALSGTTVSQSAAWSGVSPGTYTVVVVCSNGVTAGTQSVIVSAAPTPRVSPTASPTRGVMGGMGGAVQDYGTVTLVVGGALVGSGVIAAAWFLRRRSKPHRF